ncbi:MAG: polysaccharide deacetylase family protein [Deltaproteobacteria bacterium]|nr:polysaccharide deacetylase family protein [Deltaproteobacteria bacterium]
MRQLKTTSIVALLYLGLGFAAGANNALAKPPAPHPQPHLPGGCPDGKTYKVALTFDDGPNPRSTPQVIKTLQDTDTPATFFVLGDHFNAGDKSSKEWQLLREERAAGFYVGSHTYSHLPHTKMTQEEMTKNITRSVPLIGDYLAPILRLPYGDGGFAAHTPAGKAKNAQIMNTIHKAGFTHVLWDIDSQDWKVSTWPNLINSVLYQICQSHGGVALFHDAQPHTAAHIAEWIKIIRAAGHELVGLDTFVPEAAQSYNPNSPVQANTCTPPGSAVLPQDKQIEAIKKCVADQKAEKKND